MSRDAFASSRVATVARNFKWDETRRDCARRAAMRGIRLKREDRSQERGRADAFQTKNN